MTTEQKPNNEQKEMLNEQESENVIGGKIVCAPNPNPKCPKCQMNDKVIKIANPGQKDKFICTRCKYEF